MKKTYLLQFIDDDAYISVVEGQTGFCVITSVELAKPIEKAFRKLLEVKR